MPSRTRKKTTPCQRPRRSPTRRTCIGNHRPPFSAAIPRALRSAAIELLGVRPASLQRSMCGSLLGRLRAVDLGLLWIAELDAPRLGGGQDMACARADHMSLVLGGGGEHVKREAGAPTSTNCSMLRRIGQFGPIFGPK